MICYFPFSVKSLVLKVVFCCLVFALKRNFPKVTITTGMRIDFLLQIASVSGVYTQFKEFRGSSHNVHNLKKLIAN